MTVPDRARLRALLASTCVCTEEAAEEVCPRCLGLLHADVPALLNALDEAEQTIGALAIEAAQHAGRLDEAEKALRLIAKARLTSGVPLKDTLEGCRIVAREALARIRAG